MQKRDFILKAGLAGLLISIICLCALEAGVRVYSALAFPKMMILDDELGWKHASDVSKEFVLEDGTRALVVLGKDGHRGIQYGNQKPPGKYRVLFLGDSFTEGSEVNENDLFTALIEKSHPQFEVVNTGVGGYGNVQEYLYLIKSGLQLHPDLGVLMVYANDFTDNCLSYTPGMGPRPYGEWNGGQLQIKTDRDWEGFKQYAMPFPFQEWFHAHSFVYYLLDSRIYQIMKKEPFQLMWDETFKELERQDLRRGDGCRKREIFAGIVKKMATALRGVGSDLAIVAIPTRNDVAAGSSEINSEIMKVCAEEGLRCLDLLHAFVGADSGKGAAYFKINIHWTKAGHQIAAQAISSFLDSVVKLN